MSQIQNLETIGYIAKTMRESGVKKLSDINILEAPSNGYVKTTMQQAGYETISGKITGNGDYLTVKQLKGRDFPLNPKYKDFKNPYEEFMKDNGLSWDSNLYINYNIEINVKYVK